MCDTACYSPSEIVHHLLINEERIKEFSNKILAFDKDNKDNADVKTYNFEILINIAMELVFQYLHLASLAELVDENGVMKDNKSVNQTDINQDLSKYSIDELKQLLKPRMKKISILTFIHEINYNDKEYYCRIIFRDTCTNVEKKKYFVNNDIKFHFLINPFFDKTRIKNLDDVYALFKLNDKTIKLKFST